MKRPQSAADWLGQDPEVRELALRVGRLVELQAMVSACCPGLALEVLSLDEGTLALAAANASEASRLRQLEPSLVAALRRRGAAVERLRIRTRRGLTARNQQAAGLPRHPIPAHALHHLGDLGAALAPGRLREAVERLLESRQSGA